MRSSQRYMVSWGKWLQLLAHARHVAGDARVTAHWVRGVASRHANVLHQDVRRHTS